MSTKQFKKPLNKFIEKPNDIGFAAVKLLKACEPKIDEKALNNKVKKTGNNEFIICPGYEQQSEYMFKPCVISKSNLLYTRHVRFLAVALRLVHEMFKPSQIPALMRIAERCKPETVTLDVSSIMMILLHLIQDAEARNLIELRRRIDTSKSMTPSQRELSGLFATCTAIDSLFPQASNSPGNPYLSL